jgi:hypothetical protein
MRFEIDDPAVVKEARRILRETIERSGWFPRMLPYARAERIEQDVDLLWRMMAETARARLEEAGAS